MRHDGRIKTKKFTDRKNVGFANETFLWYTVYFLAVVFNLVCTMIVTWYSSPFTLFHISLMFPEPFPFSVYIVSHFSLSPLCIFTPYCFYVRPPFFFFFFCRWIKPRLLMLKAPSIVFTVCDIHLCIYRDGRDIYVYWSFIVNFGHDKRPTTK